MIAILCWMAARGPWVLVAGIAAGLLLPGLAASLVGFIPVMVAGLLFLAALRIGPERMRAALQDMRKTIAILLMLQLALPLLVIAIFAPFDILDSPFVLAVALIAMAAPISGTPSMVMMIGYDPAVAMRFLVTGTALLPLTVLPVLYFLPALGSLWQIASAALWLLGVITLSGGLAFVLRWTLLRAPRPKTLEAIDGASALLLAIIVIGLMSAVSEALFERPTEFWLWLGFVFVVNFGLQICVYLITAKRSDPEVASALTILAGNRNIALFLVALPVEETTPLLVFIGVYQIPMYLTPLVTGPFLKALARQEA